MEIKLLQELFGSCTCTLLYEKDCLQITSEQIQTIRIPFQDIKHVQIEGSGKKRKRFVIETKDNFYEGCFVKKGDAQTLIQLLKEHCGCYMDVRMDME